MDVTLQLAFVLHRRPYRETSALLELLTREHGRIGAVARGARARRGDAGLQPFQALLVAWRGRGELLTLTHWELAARPRRLQAAVLVSGLYLNELLVRLLQRMDPHPELFDAYAAALDELQREGAREQALRLFEKRLLSAIGYGLELEHDAHGRPLQADCRYRYRSGHGAEPVAANEPAGELPLLGGATLLALGRESTLSPLQLREAKLLMRALLKQQLDGRPIVSRTLLRGAS